MGITNPQTITAPTAAEVAWVARRARELLAPNHQDPAAHVEFYARKAAVFEGVGNREMARAARAAEAMWRARLVGPL